MPCPPIKLPTFPDATRRDYEKVAGSLRAVINETFGYRSPPLRLPITCCFGRPPRTSLDQWSTPTEIRIELDVPVQDRMYCQFAFQLAHELGHVYAGTYRTNFAM